MNIDVIYKENFISIIQQDSLCLFPKRFNEVSNIKVKSYVQIYDCKWIDIVNMYGETANLYELIKQEYDSFKGVKKKLGLSTFFNKHPYLTRDFQHTLDKRELNNIANIQIKNPTSDDLQSEFNRIKEKLNDIPLYVDFLSETKISISTFAKHLNNGIQDYDLIVSKLTSDNEFKSYLSRKKEHKTKVGKMTGVLSATYSNDDYEVEFHRVFNYCLKEFKSYPSRRLFNELSKFDDRSYRKKYNKAWLDVCLMYGYEVEKNHKVEKMALELIKSLTGSSYAPQKTFSWLKGSKKKALFCDGYFEDLKLVVEFDGIAHRTPVDAFGGLEKFERQLQNDKTKDTEIPKHGLKLLRIDSREPWHDIDYMKNKLIENNIPLTPK